MFRLFAHSAKASNVSDPPPAYSIHRGQVNDRGSAARRITPRTGSLLLAWSAVALAGCDPPEESFERVYETVEVRSLTVSVQASGTVKPLREITLKSKAGGKVTDTPTPTGATIRAGDVLITLDPEEENLRLRQAESNLQVADAQLGRAKALYDDLQRRLSDSEALLERGLENRDAYDALVSQRAVAKADVRIAEANLSQADAALGEARVRFRDTVIRSPIDGWLLDRFVSVGSIISSAITSVGGGTDVALVGDLSRLRVIAQINEADVGLVRPGQPAEIRADAFPDRTFKGKVTALATRGATENGITSFDCEILIEETDTGLLPEMSAMATIEVRSLVDRPALRLSATIYGANGWAAMVEAEDGIKLEKRDIKVGLDDGGYVEILEGLEVGDTVVVFSQSERERQERLEKKRKSMFGN